MLVFAEAITFNWPLNRSKADTEKIKRSGGKWFVCVGEGYGRFRRWIRVGLSGPGPLIYYRRIHNWEYTEAKVDVTQEIEQRAQQAAQAGADHCALCSISCVTSTLASV